MDKVDYIAKNYRDLKLKFSLVKGKLLNYKPISEDSVIQSLVYERNTQEKVVTTPRYDRTEIIALHFRKRQEEENKEYLDCLMDCYDCLKRDIEFFEFVLGQLSDDLKSLAEDMICKGLSWTEIEQHYRITHSTLAYRRQKLLKEIRKCYKWLGSSLEYDASDYHIPL